MRPRSKFEIEADRARRREEITSFLAAIGYVLFLCGLGAAYFYFERIPWLVATLFAMAALILGEVIWALRYIYGGRAADRRKSGRELGPRGLEVVDGIQHPK
jgi:hypothetical protein